MSWPFKRIKVKDMNRGNNRWTHTEREIISLEGYSQDYCPKIEGYEKKQIGSGFMTATVNVPIYHNRILKRAIDNEITRLNKTLDKMRV